MLILRKNNCVVIFTPLSVIDTSVINAPKVFFFFVSPALTGKTHRDCRGGGALDFKVGYHAQVQKHRKRVVFHGEARAARPVFRVSKTSRIKKKGMFF